MKCSSYLSSRKDITFRCLKQVSQARYYRKKQIHSHECISFPCHFTYFWIMGWNIMHAWLWIRKKCEDFSLCDKTLLSDRTTWGQIQYLLSSLAVWCARVCLQRTDYSVQWQFNKACLAKWSIQWHWERRMFSLSDGQGALEKWGEWNSVCCKQLNTWRSMVCSSVLGNIVPPLLISPTFDLKNDSKAWRAYPSFGRDDMSLHLNKSPSNCIKLKSVQSLLKNSLIQWTQKMVSIYQRQCLTLDQDTGNARFQADENWNQSPEVLTCASDYRQLFHFTFLSSWTLKSATFYIATFYVASGEKGEILKTAFLDHTADVQRKTAQNWLKKGWGRNN